MENLHKTSGQETGKGIAETTDRETIGKLKSQWDHPVPNDYFELAKQVMIPEGLPEGGSSSFLNHEISQNRELKDFLRMNLSGTVLVDLGSCPGRENISSLARDFGCKVYIGVDVAEKDKISSTERFTKITIKDDMLLFVARLPDNYGSFFISGAEDTSAEVGQRRYGPGPYDIDVVYTEITPYMQKLLKEIFRATKSGGILIVGPNTTLPDPEEAGFKRAPVQGKEILAYLKK